MTHTLTALVRSGGCGTECTNHEGNDQIGHLVTGMKETNGAPQQDIVKQDKDYACLLHDLYKRLVCILYCIGLQCQQGWTDHLEKWELVDCLGLLLYGSASVYVYMYVCVRVCVVVVVDKS